jgi:putative FmdB family regulatory protein
MPLYEYQCDACGHRFEVIQKYSDAPIDTCPKCGSAVHKLLSSPAIQFKGSGWYITDYARAGKSDGKSEGKSDSSSGSAAKSESSGSSDKGASESKTDSKSESKSDSKSETKSESKPTAPSTTS